jgi:hypothetical protein
MLRRNSSRVGTGTSSPLGVVCVGSGSSSSMVGNAIRVLRGVRIDLDTSRQSLADLKQVYERDLRARAVSDDAIKAVNTVVRSLEGAMGKTADAVGRRFATKYTQPYFPLTDNPADFPYLLEKQLPGLAANHPLIAEAVERHQPYHPDSSDLRYLKRLYRENHHHDFTLQETGESRFTGMTIGGMFRIGLDSVGATSGWELLVEEDTDPLEGAEVFAVGTQTWIDWYFTDPRISVATTLLALHRLCSATCEDVAATAGL